ncbi:hypothetical protein LguiB_010635 [Lonicera macranthoides]
MSLCSFIFGLILSSFLSFISEFIQSSAINRTMYFRYGPAMSLLVWIVSKSTVSVQQKEDHPTTITFKDDLIFGIRQSLASEIQQAL